MPLLKELSRSSWDSFESYSKFFRVHEKSLPKNKVHHIVIATIRSSLTTAGFKRNKDFLTFLKKHKMYVDTHHFSSKDWDISNPSTSESAQIQWSIIEILEFFSFTCCNFFACAYCSSRRTPIIFFV